MSLSVIYLGLATDPLCSKVAVAFHDGNFNMDSIILDLATGQQLSTFYDMQGIVAADQCRLMSDQPSSQEQASCILGLIENYSKENGHDVNKVKILAAGVDSDCPFTMGLCHALWDRLDIIPFTFSLKGGLEERADSASRKCIMMFGPDRIPRLTIGYRNQVEVDAGCIRLARLEDYQATASELLWSDLIKLSQEFKQKNLRFAYFNATPQGGGVALMRHSMCRIFGLLDVSMGWYVPKPNPAVFRITKHNHNILQGIAEDGIRFNKQSQEVYERWVKQNCERFWCDGPFSWCDFVILDDPQVVGYVPYIKRSNPNAKIIYRSHIEIRSDLIAIEGSPQHELWQYMWSFLKDVDVFVSHPIEGFVPDTVPKGMRSFLPASTDPLDGLNKHLRPQDVLFWLNTFNRLSFDQMGNQLDFPNRRFICQIARFDPSKGYPDVLEAYLKLCEKMRGCGFDAKDIPQLALCGHGSIDDPDASFVYSELLRIIGTSKYSAVKSDICIVRAPAEDRLLNALLRSAHVALQLSHREGFEIKVTESLFKGTPIIVYKTGGIPLQLPPKYPLIVERGEISLVVDHLLKLFTDHNLHSDISTYIKQWSKKDEFFSVQQATNWLKLMLKLVE